MILSFIVSVFVSLKFTDIKYFVVPMRLVNLIVSRVDFALLISVFSIGLTSIFFLHDIENVGIIKP
jgi:hypothetical protein